MNENCTIEKRKVIPLALFLGVSWTWVIGMFLPVLLVRDMGVWGWVVFAVPNVIGAAAMGFVLKSRTQSLRMVRNHAGFARLFSIVTIAFHFYFVKWFVDTQLGVRGAIVYLAILGMIFGYVAYRYQRGTSLLAGLGWVFSLGAMGYCAVYSMGHEIVVMPTSPRALDALFMAPVCVLGFLLCPYLDLTFHQARLGLGKGEARWGFGLGFGVVFFAMIGFSLMYAPWLAGVVAADPSKRMALPAGIGFVIAAHMLTQAAITIVFHLRALADERLSGTKKSGMGLGLAIGAGSVALGWLGGNGELFGYQLGEVGYRGFLGFYGFIFPTYGLMNFGWGRAKFSGILRAVLVMLMAGPLFGMGFLMGRMIWLVPGVLVVLMGWQQEGIIRRKRK